MFRFSLLLAGLVNRFQVFQKLFAALAVHIGLLAFIVQVPLSGNVCVLQMIGPTASLA